MEGIEQLHHITSPHCHDVLSGRGNIANRHPGNEHFRSLVKNFKNDYVKSAKSGKPLFSKLIYDEIRSMNPPGRFLKQDPQTKLWHDIGKKAALAKTRQALREGAPELLMGLQTADHLAHASGNAVPDVTNDSDQMKTILLNYLPRNESMESLGDESLLSLGSGTNGTAMFSGKAKKCSTGPKYTAPSLASSSVSSNQGEDPQLHTDQFANQFHVQSNQTSSIHGVKQEPFQIPTSLRYFNTVPLAVNQTINQQNTIENAMAASSQDQNGVSSNALMALFTKMNAYNTSGNVVNYTSPSLASSGVSSHQGEDFQPADQFHVQSSQTNTVNGFKQGPFQIPTKLNCLNNVPPAVNQTSTHRNDFKDQNNTFENTTTGSNQDQNVGSPSALMALLAKVNANNSIINGNLLANQITSRINNDQYRINTAKHDMINHDANQAGQSESGFHSTLLQQLQSQQAYHQLLEQLGQSQTAETNSYYN
jgi:hypothetical protein